MFGLLNLLRPAFSVIRAGPAAMQQPSTIITRGLMRTHKGAAKRWRKTSTGYKRGKAGRSHGNAGWSKSLLKGLSGKTANHKSHTKRLKKLLPYH